VQGLGPARHGSGASRSGWWLDEASGQAGAERGDLNGDLALAVYGAGWCEGMALLVIAFLPPAGEGFDTGALKALP